MELNLHSPLGIPCVHRITLPLPVYEAETATSRTAQYSLLKSFLVSCGSFYNAVHNPDYPTSNGIATRKGFQSGPDPIKATRNLPEDNYEKHPSGYPVGRPTFHLV